MPLQPGGMISHVQVSAWSKLIAWLVVIPAAVFFESGRASLMATLGLAISCGLSGAPIRRWLKSLAVYLLPLALAFGAILIVTRPFDLRVFAEWPITVLRFGVLLGFGLLFSMTTTPLDLVQGLRRIGVPQAVAIALMAAYRTVPLLTDRLETIVAAQRARGAKWKTVNPVRLAALVLSLGVPAVYAATDVALSLADSLHIRGYRPNRRITIPPTPIVRIGDVIVLAIAAIVIVSGFDVT